MLDGEASPTDDGLSAEDRWIDGDALKQLAFTFVLEKAVAEGRVVVTLDKDFGTLAVAQKLSHSGILRLVDLRIADQAERAHDALVRFGDQLLAGALVTIEPTRIRIRPAEKPSSLES